MIDDELMTVLYYSVYWAFVLYIPIYAEHICISYMYLYKDKIANTFAPRYGINVMKDKMSPICIYLYVYSVYSLSLNIKIFVISTKST